jgi:hypothetical protein
MYSNHLWHLNDLQAQHQGQACFSIMGGCSACTQSNAWAEQLCCCCCCCCFFTCQNGPLHLHVPYVTPVGERPLEAQCDTLLLLLLLLPFSRQ